MGDATPLGARGVRGARGARATPSARAYTAVKDPDRTKFVYRDRLWQGADLAALGVASFGHVNGVHVQNLDTWETYGAAIDRGELPLGRAYRPSADERLIRETILQLKQRRDPARLLRREVRRRRPRAIRRRLASTQATTATSREFSADRVALTREGLLRVDMLLHRFFLSSTAGAIHVEQVI